MSEVLDSYLVKAAKDLPTLPNVVSQVMKAVQDPNTSGDDVRKPIEQDPALAARVLKVANSALYGIPHEVRSLGQAIGLLGRRTIQSLVMSASMKNTYRHFGLMEKLLWEHSTLAGPVTAKLAQRAGLKIDTDEAFTAGLLHNIGKTALANSHHDEYQEVVAQVYNDKGRFIIAEIEKFGFNHAELGARVAEMWNLPSRLVSVIRHHHHAFDALSELPELDAQLTAITSVASGCLNRLGVGRREPLTELDLAKTPAWIFLGFAEDDVDPMLQFCEEQVAQSRALLD